MVLDSDLMILTANHSFYETFKVTPEKTIGNFIYDLGNRQWDIPKLRVLFEDILPLDSMFNGYEVEHDFQDIGRKIILLNARQIFRNKIGSHIILLAMEDITARRRAEDKFAEKRQELEELNKSLEVRIIQGVGELRQKDQLLIMSRIAAMGEMLGNIAHQWRQPFNVLGLLVQDLGLSYESGEFSKELLDTNIGKVMEILLQLSQTIDDFSNFATPDKEKTLFKVDQVIMKTISLNEESFKNNHIAIDISSSDDPEINGYPHEYAQVLLNILMNARDAFLESRKDNARIVVRAWKENDRSVVTITDNAGGIKTEILGKIFEPYFTTKDLGMGTGVGLFLSKTIIEKNMGGRLNASNTGDGVELRIEV
jgi:signal transduction histidine kinase